MKLEATRQLYPSEWIAFRAVEDQQDPEGEVVAHHPHEKEFNKHVMAYRKSAGQRTEGYFVGHLYITFAGPAPVPKATQPDDTDLVECFVRRCRNCGALTIPRVRYIGCSADWSHHAVSWTCPCGVFGEIRVGYDWGEIAEFGFDQNGNPGNFMYLQQDVQFGNSGAIRD
jgi:hypothetical protein